MIENNSLVIARTEARAALWKAIYKAIEVDNMDLRNHRRTIAFYNALDDVELRITEFANAVEAAYGNIAGTWE